MKLVLCNLQLTAYNHSVSACEGSRAAGYPIETLIKSPGYRRATSQNNGLPRQVARARVFSKCQLKLIS